MELFTSKADIEEALQQKEAGEEAVEDVGVRVKDYPTPQRTLDLHGQTGSEAMFELENFINRAIEQKVRTVRVITGKGLHSKHMRSVIPELTEKKLAELRKAKKILAFRRDKTGGAFVVYLIS